ncbi:MAG: SRPBCC family protein [Tumebacillaceae bacterium]
MWEFSNREWIAAVPEVVFSYFTDMEKLAAAIPYVARFERVTPGEFGVGSQVRQVQMVEGKEVSGVVEIAEFEPNRVIALRNERGPVSAVYRYALEEENGGTRLAFVASIAVEGADPNVEPEIVGVIRDWDINQLQGFKAAIETPVSR